MAGVYRPQHPERTVLYRVFFHHFERFLTEYESRFEREHGFLRPNVREVVEKYRVDPFRADPEDLLRRGKSPRPKTPLRP
jgi:hypothetical protein